MQQWLACKGRVWRGVAACVLAWFAIAGAGAEGRTPRPTIAVENPGSCIAPVAQMRREHPDMLRHQRDLTVRAGVRGARASLRGCIDCHANHGNASVLGSDENFCQGCHRFVGVRLDCFECHTPAGAMRLAAGRPPAP